MLYYPSLPPPPPATRKDEYQIPADAPYSEEVFDAAIAHLGKWELVRPVSDRSLHAWATEQFRAYGETDKDYGRPAIIVVVWMSWTCTRLSREPTPDEGPAMPPPPEAILAWERNRARAEQEKIDARMKVLAKRKSPAPVAMRKLPLFKEDGVVSMSNPAAAVACAKHQSPSLALTVNGGLDFAHSIRFSQDHDRSKCSYCKLLAKNRVARLQARAQVFDTVAFPKWWTPMGMVAKMRMLVGKPKRSFRLLKTRPMDEMPVGISKR